MEQLRAFLHYTQQDYRIGAARKMPVDTAATPDLLLLIQKLRTMHHTDMVVFPTIDLLIMNC